MKDSLQNGAFKLVAASLADILDLVNESDVVINDVKQSPKKGFTYV